MYTCPEYIYNCLAGISYLEGERKCLTNSNKANKVLQQNIAGLQGILLNNNPCPCCCYKVLNPYP